MLAAVATCNTALAKTSEAITPVISGISGRVGYVSESVVGKVNFALPAVTRTRAPSSSTVTGLLGSDLEISLSRCPETKTFPLWVTSAEKSALLDFSWLDADKCTLFLSTFITIPCRAGLMGREGKLFETQLTASAKVC